MLCYIDIGSYRSKDLHDRIKKRFIENREHWESDLSECIQWAVKTLTDYEGSGHLFEISIASDNRFVCSFAKPSWPGDHSSHPMFTAQEAIVLAVCEYLEGA